MGTATKRFEVTAVEKIAATEGTVALALGGMRLGGQKAGISARVELKVDGDALVMGVSRLDGETEWIVDSLGKAGGCPFYANGVGARYCKLKSVADAEIAAALDAAAGEVK